MNFERTHRTSDTELDRDSKRALLDLFRRFDDDDDGYIDSYELDKVMKMIGMNPTPEHVDFLLATLDVNGDGRLSLEELASQWRTLISHSVCGDEMMDAFKAIDTNRDGYIRLPELRRVLTTRGRHPLSGPEVAALLEQLVKEYDTNGDGKFSYPEFVDMYIEGVYPFRKPTVVSREMQRHEYTYENLSTSKSSDRRLL